MASVLLLLMNANFSQYPLSKTFAFLLVITISAWSFLIYQYWKMTVLPMSEMWMPPNSADQWQYSDFIFVYTMWSVMMAAMMLPSAVPMIGVFSKTCLKKYGSDVPYSLLFSCAYLLVWFLFSIVLTLMQWQLHSVQWLSNMMENSNALFAAVIFMIAGIYQFSEIKDACLKHCRSPLSFLLNCWKNNKWGAFKMGFSHGVMCVGCCWAQMLIMFAVGVMNLTAMIIITFLVIIEKIWPGNNTVFSKAVGVFLCLWGGMLFFNLPSIAI